MDVDEKLIRHVASVARLNLTDEEVKSLTPELKAVLDTFSELSQADTKGIEPAFHPIDVSDNARSDEPQDCLPRDKALALTPHKKDGYFKGPKAIEK